MADILGNNGFQQAANAYEATYSKLPYATLLGAELKDAIKSHITGGTGTAFYDVVGGGLTREICDLSDTCLISLPTCNYSGDGVSCTTFSVAENVWRDGSVLDASGVVAVKTITQIQDYFILNIAGLSTAVSIDSGRVNSDIILAYYAARTEYIATGTDAVILQTWYNYVSGDAAATSRAKRLSESNYVKVCDPNFKTGSGASCTWTVPAGATRAMFQAWGAGKGTNPSCCCGGASFGQNGAYTQLQIDVTPGDSYTVCAGCSCSRYCCSNTDPGPGCASGVTGPGICCLRAAGANCALDNCNNMNHMRTFTGHASSACGRFQSPLCSSSGPCWCGLGEYCFDNSCSTCGVVPVYPACCSGPHYCSCGQDAVTPCQGPTQGHYGIHGGGCLDTNNYGYHIRPPIIDADTGSQFSEATGCYRQTFTSGTNCGGCEGASWTWHPGHGGAGTHIIGGTNDHQGDTGRGGMVQISWT
jgi:hypothetical protein